MHHAHVAGHLQHGRQIHHAIAPAVVVKDRPAANCHRAGVIHRGAGINRMLLQGQGQVDRFKGGSGFVEVLHGPFAKETGRILPELIGVVGGTGGEGEDLAVTHIHHQGHPPLGTPLLHLLGQGQLGHLLQAGIQRQLQAQVVAVEHPRPQAIG